MEGDGGDGGVGVPEVIRASTFTRGSDVWRWAGVRWGHRGSCGVIWGYVGSYGVTWGHMELYGVISGNVGS